MSESQIVRLPLGTVSQLAVWDATGLSLPPDLALEDWQELGAVLARMERGHQWWIGDWWAYGKHAYGERAAAAGEHFQAWADAGWVATRIGTSRRREVLSWSQHREVAPLAPDEQEDWLDRAEAEHLSVMDLRTEIKRSRIIVSSPVPLPAGKYSVLMADPPWRYDFAETDAARAIENQYPTMEPEEIAALAVGDLAADNAVLFLWATNPKLNVALPIVEAWGFTYVTNLVWVKDRIGMGYWARQRHELILVCKRGDMAPPPQALRPDSVIEAPRGRHSEKPEALHEFIEMVWPDEPKIELFAREPRPGWAVWGNQA